MLGYELLGSYSNISHFVTTRQGGYGEGSYGTFNCTPYSGDRPEVVMKNQKLLCSFLPESLKELVIPHQTHSSHVALIGQDYVCLPESEKEIYLHGVDALISDLPGYCLCVSTADCVPLLFYDTKQDVIAAVHAGWRGTVQRIAGETIKKMGEHYDCNPSNIIACIGPSISLASFETGDEVYQAFLESGFDISRIATRNPITNKWHIDLWEANRLELLDLGVLATNIEVAGVCTYNNQEQFFSARRLGIKSGRILSGIMIV